MDRYLTKRLATLTAALASARADENEARACGFVSTNIGPVFLTEATAIREAIEAQLCEVEYLAKRAA